MITRLVLTSSYILFGIAAPCILYNYRFHLLYSDEMKPKVEYTLSDGQTGLVVSGSPPNRSGR